MEWVEKFSARNGMDERSAATTRHTARENNENVVAQEQSALKLSRKMAGSRLLRKEGALSQTARAIRGRFTTGSRRPN